MSDVIEFAVLAIISIVVIVNPASTSAVFIALTQEMSHAERVETAKRANKYALTILIIFALTGFTIFQLFGISIGAFKIAGGIVLFTVAISMLYPKPSSEEAKSISKDIAIIPLAIPFTAGPGTITTVVVLMTEADSIIHQLIVFGGIGIAILLSYLVMAYSEKINAVLKEGGRAVMTKLMGLIVMAISIQFIINGIKDAIPMMV